MKIGLEFWPAALLVLAALFGFGGSIAIAIDSTNAPKAVWLLSVAGGLALAATLATRKGLQEAARDVEDALRRTAALEEEMERHRKAIDALARGLKSAIFVCDRRAQVLYANSRAREMFRFEESAGRSILAVTIDYELEQIVLEAAKSPEPLEKELVLKFPEDRTVMVRAWLESDDGRVFVSLYDITELRRLERVRQDFVANVSHELRTPLSAIRSLAETLHDEPKAPLEKRSDYLSRITAEVDRLAIIVSDLLVLSSAESGPVFRQPCNLAMVVQSCLDLLRDKAKAKGLHLKEQLEDSIVIPANAEQIKQVAINLVDNAINYTLEGHVEVTLAKDAHEAVFTVADTGIGIASEELPRIFERFYRVDKGRSRATGGTGLGLSIVRHIVEAHGGRVDVESTLNEGTRFTVRLPMGGSAESNA